jgi:hypothetical protein
MGLQFGLGQLSAIPTGANPTPVPFALLEGVTVSSKYGTKNFRGPYQGIVDEALIDLDVTIKVKNAHINGATLAAFLSGSSLTTGSVVGVTGELATIPTTPFQVTVANGATFAENYGVLDITANKWLQCAATASATGIYAVNTATGVYTFNTADVGHNLAINYGYTAAAVGKTLTLNNQLQGTTNYFALAGYDQYNSKYIGRRYPRVTCPSIQLDLKPTDYTKQDLEFHVLQDAASALMFKLYTAE